MCLTIWGLKDVRNTSKTPSYYHWKGRGKKRNVEANIWGLRLVNQVQPSRMVRRPLVKSVYISYRKNDNSDKG